MATITAEDRDFAGAYGYDPQMVADMRERMEALQASRPDTSEVTRWTQCPECNHRDSVSISLVDPEHHSGSWTCDGCGVEWVDQYRFTKAEMARLKRREERF